MRYRPNRQTSRSRRGGIAAGLVAVVLLTAACGDTSSSPEATDPTPAPDAKGATTVVIDTFAFMPKVLHVKVGDTVTWTNKDDILHTVTSGTREYEPGDSGRVTATNKDGMFDMHLDGRGATAKFTFTTTGAFHYFCNQHPGMEADVDVS